MNDTHKLLLSGALAGIGLGLATAQTETPAEVRPEAAPTAEAQAHANVHRATILQGSRVENHLGDRLGTVSDVLVDFSTGEVAYLLVREGLTRMAGDSRVVPPQAFNVRPFDGFAGIGQGVVLTIEMDEPTWERSPTVDPDRVGDLHQADLATEIYKFYGRDAADRRFHAADRHEAAAGAERDAAVAETPAEEGQVRDVQAGAAARPAEPLGRLLSADDLTRTDVTDAEGRGVGRIDDMIVDLSDGQLAFVVIRPDTGLFERADSEYAVAPQAITFAAEERIQLNLTEPQLQSAQLLTEQTMKQEAAKVAGQDRDELRQTPPMYRLERSGILGN